MKKNLMKAFCFLMAVGYCGIVLAKADDHSYSRPVPSESKEQTTCACDPCNACEPCKACEICPPCPPCEPCCTEVPVIGEPCNCAYNAPARIDPLCGWDAWLSLSFIYWQANEKGLELGTLLSGTTNNHDYEIINMDFDYVPGFKIGAGMSFCRDNWTLYLEYTRLKSDDCKTVDISTYFSESTVSNSINSPWFTFFEAEGYDLLKAKWEFDYNTFDLELGRPFYLGSKLIFKPHFGLRAGWLDQEYDIYGNHVPEAGEGTAMFSDSWQDTWFIGPRAGLDTDWLIGHDFRIFGNVAGSLVYQNFDVDTKESTPFESPAVYYYGNDEFGTLTPNIDFVLGLGYGTYLCNSTWYFDFTLGYDFHYFWNQNMMRNMVDYLDDYRDHDSGDLKLHGLTITARLDF